VLIFVWRRCFRYFTFVHCVCKNYLTLTGVLHTWVCLVFIL